MATQSSSDRAPFSSVLALIAAVTISAFTWGLQASMKELQWNMWLVVGWSFAMAFALAIWAVRDWLGIHWIGNPTLSMVAGASGSSLAAVALAFSLASSKEQDVKVAEQKQVLDAQLLALRRIEQLLLETNKRLAAASPSITPSSGNTK